MRYAFLPQGEYTLNNGSLSMDLINAASNTLRLDGSIWRMRSNVLDGAGHTHLCVDTAGEFFRVRNRPPPSPSAASGKKSG